MKPSRTHIMLCAGTGCVSNGSFKIKELLERELKKHDLQDEVRLEATGEKKEVAISTLHWSRNGEKRKAG